MTFKDTIRTKKNLVSYPALEILENSGLFRGALPGRKKPQKKGTFPGFKPGEG
jgi:hypothetical protein